MNKDKFYYYHLLSRVSAVLSNDSLTCCCCCCYPRYPITAACFSVCVALAHSISIPPVSKNLRLSPLSVHKSEIQKTCVQQKQNARVCSCDCHCCSFILDTKMPVAPISWERSFSRKRKHRLTVLKGKLIIL